MHVTVDVKTYRIFRIIAISKHVRNRFWWLFPSHSIFVVKKKMNEKYPRRVRESINSNAVGMIRKTRGTAGRP